MLESGMGEAEGSECPDGWGDGARSSRGDSRDGMDVVWAIGWQG